MIGLQFSFFIFTVTFEYEHTIRDEFGWVEGHGLGCKYYRKKTETKRIVAPDEKYAEAWILRYYQKERNVYIDKVEGGVLVFDAVIEVTQ